MIFGTLFDRCIANRVVHVPFSITTPTALAALTYASTCDERVFVVEQMTKFAFSSIFRRWEYLPASSFDAFPVGLSVDGLEAFAVRHVVTLRTRPTASTSTGQPDGVCSVVRVTSRAMCLPRVHRRGTIAAHDVFFSRHWLKMRGIHTRTVAAQMIKHQARRNWSYEPFIGQSVTKPVSTSQFYLRVCIPIESPAVFPAASLDVASDARHKPAERVKIVQPIRQWATNQAGKILTAHQFKSNRFQRIISHEGAVV